MVNEWCRELNLSVLNSRLIKLGPKEFEMRICSKVTDSSKAPYLKSYKKDGITLKVTAADFGEFMTKCINHIEKSIPFASGENQKKML